MGRSSKPSRARGRKRPGAFALRAAAALVLALASAPAAAGAAAATAAEPAAVELPPGTELRAAPDWQAPVIAVSAGGAAPLAGASFDGWIEVRHGETTAWVRLDDPAGWPASGPAALARARLRLGAAAAVERRLGPFAAATDLPDDERWRALDRLAGAAAELWAERYGLDPAGIGREERPEAPPETVVVFAREEDYLAAAPAEGAGLAGHAAAGFTLLWAGDRSQAEIGGTLVHELTHLLNRRAFGPEPPAWLDEGMAEDLALARIDTRGNISAEPLTRRSIHRGHRIDLYGPLVSLGAVVATLEAGSLFSLAEMLALDRAALLASPDRNHLYAYYGFWIRYLMEGEGGALRDGFRAYLAGAAKAWATGDPAAGGTGAELLAAALGRGWPELEAGYHGWLRGLPRRLELPGPR